MEQFPASKAAWITTIFGFIVASAMMFAQTLPPPSPSANDVSFRPVTPERPFIAKEYVASDGHCTISLYKDESLRVSAYDPNINVNGIDVQVRQFLILRPQPDNPHDYSYVPHLLVTREINGRYNIVSSNLGYDVFETRYQAAAMRDLPADMQQAFSRALDVDVSTTEDRSFKTPPHVCLDGSTPSAGLICKDGTVAIRKD